MKALVASGAVLVSLLAGPGLASLFVHIMGQGCLP